mmetsp:Transcript_635/g.1857  ORF Transcript_635/g.1857 Transcript_635/m.1857 type:complete len:318 (-) Transcript_635:1840-2793(-)|eukprot:CAMPEP_0206146124 /NCGR_PEP_ID=MMETSP1473-20131121/29496_1 /ASSEMBLY_ACC=CAM_ASM_001109 /TAXON_ID=1461547 /ORGANISM="Stichococcus sp, Strain RCC1054" /LENGTH=317 /DNA_ID=CAMNT_0053542575 /DNA_START=168 /DNA_END=1121 /DNA_ORIENTATION=+
MLARMCWRACGKAHLLRAAALHNASTKCYAARAGPSTGRSPHQSSADRQAAVPRRKRKQKLIDLCIERFPDMDQRKLASLILQGKMLVKDKPVDTVGAMIHTDSELRIKGQQSRWASRAGDKLDAALEHFGVDVRGLVALDAGLSTGGFTDCLLHRGAAHVIGVDVGTSLVADALRQDPRLTVMEGTNLRYLTPDQLPALPQIVTLDLSFISVLMVMPAVVALMPPQAQLVSLIKPQFEARREEVEPGGVVTSDAVHADVIERITQGVRQAGLTPHGIFESPVRGAVGKNKEFFIHATYEGQPALTPGQQDSSVLDP